MKRSALLFYSIVCLMYGVNAQNLRTAVPFTVTLESSRPEGESVNLHYNEAVGIVLGANAAFIQGVELELRIPKAFQGAESSIIWTIYTGIKPATQADRFDYSGEQLFTQPLPARVSLIIQLPVSERHGLRSGPYATLIPALCTPDKFPLMFKLSSINKGIPPSMETALFKVTVRPILTDEGGIRIQYPDAGIDRKSVQVFIDDRRIDDWAGIIYLKKGLHVVRIAAEGYREEVISAVIESGKVLSLTAKPLSDSPLLKFQAPSDAQISLDGKPLDMIAADGLEIESGEHTLLCVLGNYSLSRKFTAIRGKTYTIVLSVELEINTDP